MKLRSFSILRWFILALLLWQVNSFAVSSPLNMLQAVSNQMFSNLNQNISTLRGPRGSHYIHRLVNRYLIPNVDVNRMSAAVVGRKYWQQASASQRRSFISGFTKMVIATYSGALKTYHQGDKLRFYPIGSRYKTSKYVSVKSLLARRNGQRIPISYNLRLVGSRWKIYDFSIENISITQSYRSQFASILSSKGFSGLLSRMKSHNKNF